VISVPYRKKIKKKYDVQFPINLILKDEIEKKSIEKYD
jgi:cbb3-type cytochrome oxidase subunit 3